MAKQKISETMQLFLSKEIMEKLEETVHLYKLPADDLIQKILADTLPKWIQMHHMKQKLQSAAEKSKTSQEINREEVLINQDELDKVFRIMSSGTEDSSK